MKAAIDHIRPGMTELEARAEIDYACAKAGGEHPGEPTFLLAGQRSAHPHAPSSRYVIMPGDIVRIDLCGVYHRYHAVMARTLSIGEPHPDVAKQIDLAAKSWSELSKSIQPNCPLLEFSQAMEEYYRAAGILEDAWWVGGYELGIAFPPDWVGVFLYGMGKEPEGRILLPGTVINYETDLYLPEGEGMSEITATIAIEILRKIPCDLVVIEV